MLMGNRKEVKMGTKTLTDHMFMSSELMLKVNGMGVLLLPLHRVIQTNKKRLFCMCSENSMITNMHIIFTTIMTT